MTALRLSGTGRGGVGPRCADRARRRDQQARDPGSCALSALGGAAALAGGVSALLSGNSRVVSPGGSVVVGTLQLQATSLAGVFAALLGVVAVAIALYVPRYQRAWPRERRCTCALYNLALLASLAVLAAGGVVTFLVAWETMALLCYLLILRHPRSSEVAGGAFWFLALSETGFVLIVAAFVILATKTHSMQLDLIAARAHLVPGGWRDTAYLLALTGFGFKAGLVPLHVWLPDAHPVAPADGSAFLSGLIVKLGVYGIALFAFRLLPDGPAWRGVLTMAVGAVTAAIGILYALSERDIKRFLAYLHDREHRHHRHRVRRRDDVPGLRPAAAVGVPAARRPLPRGQPRQLQDAAVPGGRGDRARHRAPGTWTGSAGSRAGCRARG